MVEVVSAGCSHNTAGAVTTGASRPDAPRLADQNAYEDNKKPRMKARKPINLLMMIVAFGRWGQKAAGGECWERVGWEGG